MYHPSPGCSPRRFLVRLIGALCLGLWLGQPALAQALADDSGSKEAWVVSYALVILFVGLGLFIVSIPSRRERRVRKK
jgi:hypothetical protein